MNYSDSKNRVGIIHSVSIFRDGRDISISKNRDGTQDSVSISRDGKSIPSPKIETE